MCSCKSGPHLGLASAAIGDVGSDGIAEEAGVLCYDSYLASIPLCVHLGQWHPINQNLNMHQQFNILAPNRIFLGVMGTLSSPHLKKYLLLLDTFCSTSPRVVVVLMGQPGAQLLTKQSLTTQT